MAILSVKTRLNSFICRFLGRMPVDYSQELWSYIVETRNLWVARNMVNLGHSVKNPLRAYFGREE